MNCFYLFVILFALQKSDLTITNEANDEGNFGKSAGRSSSYFTVFITIGVENFGKLYTVPIE